MRIALGFALAFALGFACRVIGIPLPAPPILMGALLVLAMTCGYVLVDRVFSHRPTRHSRHCAGPIGRLPSHDPSEPHKQNAFTPE
jgi:XapX domain-containing protein